MTPETWQRVNEIVVRALDLPADGREGFVARACAGCETLDREVRSLLGTGTSPLPELDRPAVDLLASPRGPGAGYRIGSYRIVREIGRGGTGVVYLAARDDGELERRVAIKVLRPGRSREDLVRRFRNERQILANLAHPNIAELYEAGSTADGLPYFVMEHVDGEAIDVYCDSRRLRIRRRLELFVRICSAVELAHRSLVVHRDLKPSNILVTASGEPKLLDFGIAKLLDPETFRPLTVTEAGRHMMTPAYASPEQIRGEAVTTATDVYSLGALLYELLCGEPPHGRHLHAPLGATPRQLEERICNVPPEEPSGRIAPGLRRRGVDAAEACRRERIARDRGQSPQRLRRRLAGDLDNIVMRALRQEPERRYPSVASLARDVERHLHGLPVAARRDTPAYRFGKWVRRRRKEAAALVLLVLLSIAWGWERVESESRLQHERDRARRVSDFLLELFAVADPGEARGNAVTAREILDRGVERIHEELVEEPKLRSELMLTMSRIYRNLGLYDPAEELAATSLELCRGAHGENSAEMAEALAVRATLHYEQGRLPRAEELLRRSFSIRRQRLGEEHPLTVSTLADVAVMLERQGRYGEAEQLLRQVLDLQRRILGPRDLEVAKTLGNLGVLLQNLLDHPGAEAAFRESLEIKRLHLGEDHPSVALAFNNLALLVTEKGDFEEAESLFGRTLEIARKVYGEEHPNVARSLSSLGWLYLKAGESEKAEATIRRSLEMRRELLGPDHPGVVRNLVNLARVALVRGDAEGAAARAREAVSLLPEDETVLLPIAESVLGGCLLELGRLEEARELLERSYAVLLRSRGAVSADLQRTLLLRIRLHEALGEPERAAELRSGLVGDG